MQRNALRRLLGASALMAVAIAGPAFAQGPEVRLSASHAYAIPAGDLGAALSAFSRTSDVQIVAPPKLVKGLTTRGVSGTRSDQDALSSLLAGTGLKATVKGNVVAIVKGAEADGAVRPISSSAANPELRDAARQSDAGTAAEITVTGTRIVKAGYSAPVPLTVIDQAQVVTAGSPNIGDVLLKTPSIGAGLNSFNASGAVANMDAGAAFVDLRGLGANRSLTLVNGRRRVSGSRTSSAVDLNVIPAAMIDRVEIITGGSSAIYGADAVSGVVNIITKTNYNGFEIAASGGISEEGDAENRSVNFFGGTKFAEDRGYINFSASYNKEEALFARDRSYTFRGPLSLANPANTNAHDGVPDAITYPQEQAREYSSITNLAYPNFYLNKNTWAYTENGLVSANPKQFVSQSGDFVNGFGYPGPVNFGEDTMRTPLEVTSMRSDLSYQLTDGVKFFAEGEFSRTKSRAATQYLRFDTRSLWFSGRGGPQIQLDNYYLPAEVRALMQSAGATTIGIRDKLVNQLGTVDDIHDRKIYSIVAGLEGELFDNWKWDASYQYGRTSDDIETTNLLHNENFLNAVDVVADPVTGSPVCRNVTARAAGCVPLNIFSVAPFTQAQRDYFVRNRREYAANIQEVYSAHLSGELFNLPAGALTVAAGAEHRKERLVTWDDGLILTGQIQAVSASAHPPLDKQLEVTEGYGEILAPLIRGVRFVDALSLDSAVRVSDYTTIGRTLAWQAGVNWTVSDDMRLRFTRSRSVRAPNLVELFAPTTVTESSYFNPCAAQTIDANANRRRNCLALGTPASGGTYQVQQARFISGGNPDAKEETSNSLTVGAVVTPRAIPNLRLSVDYYRINIKDALSSFSAGDTLQRCVDANSIEDNVFCNQIVFNSVGEAQITYTNLVNASSFSSSGIDFSADYRFPIGASGRAGLRLAGTYLMKKEYVGVPGDKNTLVIYDGEYTDPKLRVNLTVSYDRRNWGVSVTNRFIGKSVLDAQGLPEARDLPDVPAKIYTDAVVNFDLNKEWSGFIGINNVLDVRPPQRPETYRYGAYYDLVGRFFHAGIKAKF